MEPAEPIRIPLLARRREAVNRRFLGFFWLFAVDFAVAAFYRPALIPFIVGFPMYILLWVLASRRDSAGLVLAISENRLALEGAGRRQNIERTDVGRVDFPGKGHSQILQIVDSVGNVVLQKKVDEGGRGQLMAAFLDRGWPLGTSGPGG